MEKNNQELQLENGNYTRIVNKIIDELIRMPLLGSELAICLFVIRKTYGFNKKEDAISLSQFQKGIGRSRPTIVKALKVLVLGKVLLLVKEDDKKGFTNKYRFNKYYKEWSLVKTPELVKEMTATSKEKLKKVVKVPLHTKDNTKNNTKERRKRADRFIVEAIKKPEKDSYGELKNVQLTLDEYALLVERIGEGNLRILIDELDIYIGSKGIEYKSHYATLISWAGRRVKEIIRKKPLIAFS